VGVAEGFTVPQLLEQMNVNYLGPARMFRAALPAMRAARRGLFVTVSSLAGRLLFPFLSTYNPSKFAVEALAEIYRYELRPFGIDSVIVEPGPFLTGLIDAAPRPADAARVEAYGELGAGAEMAMTGFKQMMADNPKHDPGIVAADIVRLIEAPFGTRPLRTLSGDTYGVERINEAAAAVQRELLTVMGLAHLDPGAEVPA
ncbi:MAG TPA: SDR family NAD(P)-dependent oxidoreductase, partial [Vicinamibacterales bacterium]|nr:SDR family NAD(P)-dependent oxidoreductase [Vicinamibacterales bacterium]